MSRNVYLAHHGIKGQKHGVRRWQNPDGSLTPAGRAHYGVGAAREKAGAIVKSVGKAIRKKIAPTNAELNAQIRKQKSKNLNKQKRRELRDLKRGLDSDASSSSSKNAPKGQHKRFSEMSDQEIQDRIKRLKSEIELADLERTKSMGPGMRMVDKALREAGQQAIKNIAANYMTKAGEKAISGITKASKEEIANNRKRQYESELNERKAREELDTWKKEHPTGLGKLAPSSIKAVREKNEKEAQRKADEELKKRAERSKNEQSIYKELELRAKAYKKAGDSYKEIARKIGVDVSEVPYYLYEKPKKDGNNK